MPRTAKAKKPADPEIRAADEIITPPKMGRPSIFSQDLADRICEEMVLGKSMHKICAQDDMPCLSTVFKWLREKEGFSVQYARASFERAHTLADEAIDIADDAAGDYMPTEDGMAFNTEHVQRSKLRVDTRKWFASKLAPKVYGERASLDVIIDQSISITGALEAAKTRVIEGMVNVTPPAITDQADE